jgi:hypothetical protein
MSATSDLKQLTRVESLTYRRLVLLTHGVIGLITGISFNRFVDAHFTHSKSDALLTVGAPVFLYIWSAAYSWNLMYSWRFVSNKRLRVGLFIIVLIIGCAVTSSLITGALGSLGGGTLFAACLIQGIVNFYAAGVLLDVE